MKLIRSVHKDDYAKARSPREKLELARQLTSEGRSTADDPAGRYVLFLEARDLAVEAGEAAIALQAIDEISRRYLAVNALDLKAEALEKVTRAVKTPEGARDFTSSCFELAEESLRVNNHAVARRVSTLASASAGKSRSKHLSAWAAFLPKRVAELEKEYPAAKQALETLRREKDDAAACLTAGKFRALLKDEWEAGLNLLKRSSDAMLKALAEKELSEGPQAADPTALGELWASASERMPPPFKGPALARAIHWFAAASAGAEGLTKAKASEKLARLAGGSPDLRPGLVAEYFDDRKLNRKKTVKIDPQVDFDWGKGRPDKDVAEEKFSVRWTGRLKAPRPGKYALIVQFDDAARLWLDDELFVDRWGTSPGKQEVTVWLTDKPYPLRLEYNDWTSNAVMRLRWVSPGDSVETAVPSHAFFHDPEDEHRARK